MTMLPEMIYDDVSRDDDVVHVINPEEYDECDVKDEAHIKSEGEDEPKSDNEVESDESDCVIYELGEPKQDFQLNTKSDSVSGSYREYCTTMGLAPSNHGLHEPVNFGSVFQLAAPNPISRCSCVMCGLPIQDGVLLMDGQTYHEHCLRCCCCTRPLGEDEKCYVKENDIYCKEDYMLRFAPRCAKCQINLSPFDWVRKAQGLVFHLACFTCNTCEYSLATGDSFGVLEGCLFCKNHYKEKTSPVALPPTTSEPTGRGQKRKRSRTTFSEEQLQILQEFFETNQSPHGESLQQLSEKVGLSKRVTQVWFQNARAKIRQQKIQRLS